jgi:hypothetical protein
LHSHSAKSSAEELLVGHPKDGDPSRWLTLGKSLVIFEVNSHLSQPASSANHSQQDNHDGDHQQNVNETAHGVGSDQAKQPQDEHNDGNGIEHDIDLSF